MRPNDVQRLLDDGGYDGSDPVGHRLARARERLLAKRERAQGWADLVVLLRQVLERWALGAGGNYRNAAVYVPKAAPWPAPENWRLASFTVDEALEGRWRLSVKAWSPDWFGEDDRAVVTNAVAAVARRPPSSLPADPLIQAMLGVETATCLGQRDVIRSLYLTPSGSTILAVLPTGSGKSSAFQFAALHGSGTQGMVVVVVPTVALARDQERRYIELAHRAGKPPPLGVPLAYHGGLSAEEAHALRQAVESGTLPILFAAPEALLRSLSRPLLTAAENGRVGLFAVDEAHIVAQWAEFRPEFQAISGFRDELQTRCPVEHPFRTLLLTATLTAEGFDTLSKTFGRPTSCQDEVAVVAEVSLRSEPGYIVSLCEGPSGTEEKQRRVVEALYHLPRPLILYTTKVADAQAWHRRVTTDLGFQSARCIVGGDMTGDHGAAVLEDWTKGELDLVVATSAFGLGVDQSDVRSIIHACVPESIDRWYQEVGRAGRDGKASVALLAADKADLDTATRMANEALIGHELAFGRWNAMFTDPRRTNDGDTHQIPLDALTPGYDVHSERNRQWNMRTLVMMVQAGMLRFSYSSTPAPSETPTPAPDPDRGATGNPAPPSPTAYVSILEPDHDMQERFDELFTATRNLRRASDQKDAARVLALARREKSVQDLLRETYSVPHADIVVPTPPLGPVLIRRVTHAFEVRDPLRTAFGHIQGAAPLILTYDRGLGWEVQQSIRALAHRLTRLGVIEFAWPTEVLTALNWAQLSSQSPHRYVFSELGTIDGISEPWLVPKLTVLVDPGLAALRQALSSRPFHVLVVPSGLLDPAYPHRMFDERAYMQLPAFLEALA